MRTRIKLCGIRDPHTALVAVECGADAIGLVFAPGSPRTVSIDEAWDIVGALPPFVTSVGLFVNAKQEKYLETLEEVGFDMGQFHGTESEPTVRACGPSLIKAVQCKEESLEADLRKWSRVQEIDAILIDGGPGGTGERADWAHIARIQFGSENPDEEPEDWNPACIHPMILAGGLTPENVGDAIRAVRPWAVDVSSGVESEKGVKDLGLIKAFCDAVHDADASLS